MEHRPLPIAEKTSQFLDSVHSSVDTAIDIDPSCPCRMRRSLAASVSSISDRERSASIRDESSADSCPYGALILLDRGGSMPSRSFSDPSIHAEAMVTALDWHSTLKEFMRDFSRVLDFLKIGRK